MSEPKKEPENKEQQPVERTESVEQLVYCGPNIGRRLKNSAIFIPPLPEDVQEMIEKEPMIGALMIPLSGLVQAKMALREHGSMESVCFQELQKKQATGGEQ